MTVLALRSPPKISLRRIFGKGPADVLLAYTEASSYQLRENTTAEAPSVRDEGAFLIIWLVALSSGCPLESLKASDAQPNLASRIRCSSSGISAVGQVYCSNLPRGLHGVFGAEHPGLVPDSSS